MRRQRPFGQTGDQGPPEHMIILVMQPDRAMSGLKLDKRDEGRGIVTRNQRLRDNDQYVVHVCVCASAEAVTTTKSSFFTQTQQATAARFGCIRKQQRAILFGRLVVIAVVGFVFRRVFDYESRDQLRHHM